MNKSEDSKPRITIIDKENTKTAVSSPFSLQNLLWGRQTIHFIQDYPFPVERVFGFFCDHEKLAKIYPGAFKRIVNSMDPQNANGLGSVRLITSFPLMIEETVTGFKENELIEYRITSRGPIKDHIGTMHFSSTGLDSCRLDYTIAFSSIIPGGGFLIKNVLERAIGNGIRELINVLKDDPNL